MSSSPARVDTGERQSPRHRRKDPMNKLVLDSMLLATIVQDPDGNHVRTVQLSPEHRAAMEKDP